MMRELRVHGVGGPQEERLLGVESPKDLKVAAVGQGTRVVQRAAADDGVEGYSWGGLTSSSLNTTPWLVFVPFTLVNAAGWACPFPRSETTPRSRLTHIHNIACRLLGFGVTAAYVAWTLELFVDLVGWQWRRRLLQTPVVVETPALSGAVEYVLPVLSWIFALGLLTAGAVFIAGRSRSDREENENSTWGYDATFDTTGFYRRLINERKWRRLHFGAAGAVIALAVFLTYRRRDDAQLFLGELVVGAAMVQGACLVVLWVLAAAAPLRPWRPTAAAIATLSAVLVNATFGGLVVLAVRYLSVFPAELEEGVQSENYLVLAGPELGRLNVWLFTMAFGVGVLVVACLHVASRRRRRRRETDPPPLADITEEVRQITQTIAAKVDRAEQLARVAHGALIPICSFAAAIALGAVPYWVLAVMQDKWPLDRDLTYRPTSWPESAMAFVLVALPIGAGYLLRRSAQSTTGRRRLGVAWDVLLIWPRRFHPLAITPYAEVATREIKERVAHHLDTSEGNVLVAAHSQGSVLSSIALWRLDTDHRERVHFVTYGSPLNGLYALAFPRYFNHAEVQRLACQLRSWTNYWRSTDPIGGPVFSPRPFEGYWVPEDLVGADNRLPDPAVDDPAHDLASPLAPLERNRPAFLDLAGHSYYLAEPALKRRVADLKRDDPQDQPLTDAMSQPIEPR